MISTKKKCQDDKEKATTSKFIKFIGKVCKREVVEKLPEEEASVRNI